MARRTIETIEGLSVEEILKGWSTSAGIYARNLWEAGDRERAIGLVEALRHYQPPPTKWAQRRHHSSEFLVHMYMQLGREDDANPILQEMVSDLQSEVDSGVRHPKTLMRLAGTYAWLGNENPALRMLELAVDYGGYEMLICCEDYIPLLVQQQPYEVNWWDELEGAPLFVQSRSRMRAVVDQQRSNIRALMSHNDMEQLFEPLMAPPKESQ